MELKECYAKMGGDYEAIFQRLRQEERVKKFLSLFPKDPNYQLLADSFAAGDWPTAFRAAHSLKGVSLNLALSRLAESSSELTEDLRSGAPSPEAPALFERVKQDYEVTLGAINEYLSDPA